MLGIIVGSQVLSLNHKQKPSKFYAVSSEVQSSAVSPGSLCTEAWLASQKPWPHYEFSAVSLAQGYTVAA